jgi:hypothetical protein
MLHCSISYKDPSVMLGTEKYNATINMNYLDSENKTGLNVQCECCVKFLIFCGVHGAFSTFDSCVSHIIAPTPTKCPRTTRGMSVSPPVVGNVNFHGDLVFSLG